MKRTTISQCSVAFAWLASAAAAQSDYLYGAPAGPTTMVGSEPYVDLDGDGRLDRMSLLGLSLAVSYQDPDGSFESAIAIPQATFSNYISYASGDFYGGGLPDIVIPKGLNKLLVIPVLGKGKFGPPITTTGTGQLAEPRAVSLNNDSQSDLIGHDPTTVEGTIRTYVGKPDGTFVPTAVLDLQGFISAHAPTVVDMDGDALPDLVVIGTDLTDSLLIFPGHGDGTFGAAVSTSFNGNLWGYALADLDQDGLLDAITAVDGADEVLRLKLLRGTGQFKFATKLIIDLVSYAGDTFLGFSTAAHADVDEDGIKDIVVGSANYTLSPAGFWLLRGQGGFSFGAPEKTDVPGQGGSVALADIDGDDHLDVVQDASFFFYQAIWFGNGAGHFEVPTFPGAQTKTHEVAAGDFNGDALPDILATLDEPGGLGVWLGDGLGDLAAQPPWTGPGPLDQLDVADLDEDGALDAVASETTMNEDVHVALNDGAGNFTWGPGIPMGAMSEVVLADVTGDGHDDVVVGLPDIAAIGIRAGDGLGGLGPLKLVFAGGSSAGVDIADFDQDGLLDIATALPNEKLIYILSGSSGFGSTASWPTEFKPQRVLATDLDLDGDPDLITDKSTGASAVVVLNNAGAGTFDAPWDAPAVSVPQALAAADINRDGLVDVVSSGNSLGSGFVDVHLRQADGSLDDGHAFLVPSFPSGLAIADFDGDGFPDVVTASGVTMEFGYLLNHSATWATLGHSLTSSLGTPLLEGSGEPIVGQQVSLTTSDAPVPSLGWLIAGAHAAYTPIKDGVLVPSADLALAFPPNTELKATWPPGIPLGLTIYLQAWFVAQGEFSATNALVVLAQ